MSRIYTFLASTLGKVILAVAFVIIVFLVFRSCSDAREDAAKARQEGKEAEAYADSAGEAVNTVIARGEAENDIDAMVEKAAAEMDAASSDAERRAAALAALCQMKLYKEKPECAPLQP